MDIDTKNGNGISKKQKLFLSPETILKFLISDDDRTETLIMCKSSEIDFVTTDQSIYEALGSIKPYDDFKLPKLKKLFEVVEVLSYKNVMKKNRDILKDEKVEEIRKKALRS